jgi:hypothetical protein
MRRILRRTALVALAMMTVNLFLPLAPAAAAPNDDVLPGVPLNLTYGASGHLSASDDYDVYWIQLQRDEQLTVEWRGGTNLVATLSLLPPTAASRTAPALVTSTSNAENLVRLHYGATHALGRYYLVVHRLAGYDEYALWRPRITTPHEPGRQINRSWEQGHMGPSGRSHWWTIWCEWGKQVSVTMSDPAGSADDFDLYLFTDDGTGSPNSMWEKRDLMDDDVVTVTITPSDWGPGEYAPVHVNVFGWSGTGPYLLSWTATPRPPWADRISGRTRFDVARELQIATRWPNDEHVSDVVVASGDDAAMADPLAAAGLCWAYNSPLLLVSKNPAANIETLVRIQDIRGFSGRVRVHVVGGPLTIPPGIYDSLRVAAGGSAYIERISGANRYDLARNIALRMRDVRGDHLPGVLLANGADSTKFFDALAVSPISANKGLPVLLLRKDSVPEETYQALVAMSDTTPRYLAGGPLTVSESVRIALGATRWSGADRYATAAEIARQSLARGYLIPATNIALAAKLPDALSAGADVGFLGGPLLVVRTDSLPSPVRDFLAANKHECARLWPVGGPLSIHNTVIDQAKAAMH